MSDFKPTVMWAMNLIAEGHPNSQSSFSSIYSWHFVFEDVEYRLQEYRAKTYTEIKLSTVRLPRKELDILTVPT
jgi:hypothetical protein